VPVLAIAHHPQVARSGERIVLDSITEVSRLAPSFATGPLDDPFVSRQPIMLRRLARGAVEIGNPHGVELAIAGVTLAAGETRRIADDELADGIDLLLGDRVVLWFALDDADVKSDEAYGLVGDSPCMYELRAEIRAAAAQDGPVLITGETGVGKELVARALHAASTRSAGPLVVVNVAAIPAAVAAAELFGHERGAFTGAGDRRAGYFERAAGGVLFLDEIGELPDAVQPVLLRALESGEIQPIGGQPRRIDGTDDESGKVWHYPRHSTRRASAKRPRPRSRMAPIRSTQPFVDGPRLRDCNLDLEAETTYDACLACGEGAATTPTSPRAGWFRKPVIRSWLRAKRIAARASCNDRVRMISMSVAVRVDKLRGLP